MGIADAGELRAWQLLDAADPARTSARSATTCSPGEGYRIKTFGREILVDPVAKRIAGADPAATTLLERHGELLRLSLLWYLVKATGGRREGRLVNPASLPGGGLFARGTHVLPLDALAAAYANRRDALLAAGAALGGNAVGYGDAAIELPALPHVPVTLILWTADDEFPARADLLFDASAPRHLPTDVLWAVAMLSVRLLLPPASDLA